MRSEYVFRVAKLLPVRKWYLQWKMTTSNDFTRSQVLQLYLAFGFLSNEKMIQAPLRPKICLRCAESRRG